MADNENDGNAVPDENGGVEVINVEANNAHLLHVEVDNAAGPAEVGGAAGLNGNAVAAELNGDANAQANAQAQAEAEADDDEQADRLADALVRYLFEQLHLEDEEENNELNGNASPQAIEEIEGGRQDRN